MNILLVAINAKYIHSNPAIYSLKAYADRKENEVAICEFTINNMVDEILDSIFLKKPDILAFSCYIWNIEYVRKLLKEIKKILPKVRIWLGGPEAYYNSRELMLRNADIDIIMKGEGEATFKELCDYYLDRYNKTTDSFNEDDFLSSVKGIDFRSLKDGKIKENPFRDFVDMSTLPFQYRNISDFKNKIIYYESSRGCPFSCSYCLSSVEKKLRFKDLAKVKEELKLFLDSKVAQVKFVDRTFNCKKDHAMEIWGFIHENDNGITNFHFEVAADLIDDDELELISRMRPGLIQLEIGVQSTNETTIREIKRIMKLDKIKSVVSRIKSFKNTHQHLDLIAGLPYENLDSFIHSFNEVYTMEPNELQLGFLKVLAGSYMYDNKDTYELKYKEYPPYEVISTKWISYEEILLLKGVEEMVEVYYNSGQFVFALNYIEKYFESPFEMFYELSIYYEDNYDKNMKHSRISRYNILRDFMKTYACSQDIDFNLNELEICLTIDIYLRENAKSRPEFSKDLSIYRDKIKSVAKQLELKRNEHIEVYNSAEYAFISKELFSDFQLINITDVENNVTTQGESELLYFMIFDYSIKNVISNQCRVKMFRFDENERPGAEYGKEEY